MVQYPQTKKWERYINKITDYLKLNDQWLHCKDLRFPLEDKARRVEFGTIGFGFKHQSRIITPLTIPRHSSSTKETIIASSRNWRWASIHVRSAFLHAPMMELVKPKDVLCLLALGDVWDLIELKNSSSSILVKFFFFLLLKIMFC